MWFEDLTPCTYFGETKSLIAVGWLERGRSFERGDVDPRVFEALSAMRANPWQPFVVAGPHGCDLCRFRSEAMGSANLFVPASGVIYVCPELIVHYVNAHGYAPPEPFCGAVLACPPMRSMDYLRALKAGGIGELLRLGAK